MSSAPGSGVRTMLATATEDGPPHPIFFPCFFFFFSPLFSASDFGPFFLLVIKLAFFSSLDPFAVALLSPIPYFNCFFSYCAHLMLLRPRVSSISQCVSLSYFFTYVVGSLETPFFIATFKPGLLTPHWYLIFSTSRIVGREPREDCPIPECQRRASLFD